MRPRSLTGKPWVLAPNAFFSAVCGVSVLRTPVA